MFRRLFLAGSLAVLAAPAISGEAEHKAGTIQLTAAQIDTLLSGNTIKGTWNDAPYTQYYNENGVTLYVPEGGQPDEGKWRVKEDTDQYDSWWQSTGWTPYTVVMTNDGYAWVNGASMEPFKVVSGNALP